MPVGDVFLAHQRGRSSEGVSIREIPSIAVTVYMKYEFKTKEEFTNWLLNEYSNIEKDNKYIRKRELRVDERYDEFQGQKNKY